MISSDDDGSIHSLPRERVCGVRDEQTRLPHGSIAHHDQLHVLHCLSFGELHNGYNFRKFAVCCLGLLQRAIGAAGERERGGLRRGARCRKVRREWEAASPWPEEDFSWLRPLQTRPQLLLVHAHSESF